MQPARARFALPTPSSAVQALLIANVAVFVLGAVLGASLLGAPLSSVLGVSWQGLWEGYGLGLLRFVSYQFAHSYVDIWHIVGNMLVLYFFGTMVEAEIGPRGVVHLYLVGGFVAALVQMAVMALVGAPSDVPLVGASGSCYAITLYATLMAPRAQVYFLVIRMEMRWLTTILVAAAAYYTLLELRGEIQSGTAHAAHLGGALYGYLAFRYLRPYYAALGYGAGSWFPILARWRVDRQRRDRAHLQAELDRLLDKVHREGMGALSTAERKTLERASRELNRR